MLQAATLHQLPRGVKVPDCSINSIQAPVFLPLDTKENASRGIFIPNRMSLTHIIIDLYTSNDIYIYIYGLKVKNINQINWQE